MLSYTDEQKQAWLNDDKTLSLSFSNGLTISDENIVDESMEITYTLSDENELRWGRCNPTQFVIEVDASAINFKDLYVTPTLICGEYSQVIGTFKVVEDTKSDDGTTHTLICYDKLYEINNTDYSTWYNNINWTTINTIGKFRDAFFTYIGITQVKDSYTIDNIPLNKPLDDPKELKGSTILQAILELEGCFGRILPNGNFKHQYLSLTGDLLFPRDNLYPKDDLYPVGTSDTLLLGSGSIYGLSYIGYQSELINQVTIRQDSEDVGASTSTPSGTPNTYIIQGNFLMSGQSSADLSTVANYVLSRIGIYSMQGGNVDVEGRPWIEVGDSLYAQGLVDLIKFPILQIVRKGVHGLTDTYGAKTVKNYSETVVSQNSEIIELKGKTNKLTRDIEHTESLITDPENGLQTQVTQTAGKLDTIASSDGAEYYEGNLSINYYGYGAPDTTKYPPSSNNGKIYLDKNSGYYYTCNGTTWVKSSNPLTKITDHMESEISQSAREVKTSVSSAIQQWDTSGYTITVYGIGYPTESDYPPSQYSGRYYLDQQNGYIYYCNGSYWTYIRSCELITDDIYADLSVKIGEDDYGKVCAMIEGHADLIDFVANHMFTVTATNLNIDRYGNVEATNFIGNICQLKGTTQFKTSYDTLVGEVGNSTVESGSGLGIWDSNSNCKILLSPSGNMWFKTGSGVFAFDGTNLIPWSPYSSGEYQLSIGSGSRNWKWGCFGHLSVTDAPWDSSSDKRMKDVHGDIDKVREFYMALEPIKYTFKEGVDHQDPENMHYGLIAQDLLETYKKCYNTDKQGFVRKSEIIDEGTIKVIGEDKKYVINYDELHAFHIAMIQELRKEVDELKAEIKELRKEKG